MNEPEYERVYDANNPADKLEYAGYLWAIEFFTPSAIFLELAEGWRKVQGEQSLQQRTGEQPSRCVEREQPLQQEETWGWQSWSGPEGLVTSTRAGEPISERVLRATSTKASDWSEGYGARPRQPEAEGDAEGTWPLALQRLLEVVQGVGEQGSPAYDFPSGITPGWDDGLHPSSRDRYEDFARGSIGRIAYNLRYNLGGRR